jgi:hypothetical protein
MRRYRAGTVVASNVDVILVDAESGRTAYPDALAVAFGAKTWIATARAKSRPLSVGFSGFKVLPRLKAIHSARLSRPDHVETGATDKRLERPQRRLGTAMRAISSSARSKSVLSVTAVLVVRRRNSRFNDTAVYSNRALCPKCRNPTMLIQTLHQSH